jgi:threonine/homoserine/homoserine lactone efflux protein
MIGIESAELVHVLAVVFGLSALLAASAEALDVLRYGGAIYLVALGVKRWRDGAEEVEAQARPASARRIVTQGFVVQLLNPKVAIFFLAFFPQFLDRDSAILPQTLALGALYIAIAAASDLAYVLLASLLAEPAETQRSGSPARRAPGARCVIGLGLLAALGGRPASTTR